MKLKKTNSFRSQRNHLITYFKNKTATTFKLRKASVVSNAPKRLDLNLCM